MARSCFILKTSCFYTKNLVTCQWTLIHFLREDSHFPNFCFLQTKHTSFLLRSNTTTIMMTFPPARFIRFLALFASLDSTISHAAERAGYDGLMRKDNWDYNRQLTETVLATPELILRDVVSEGCLADLTTYSKDEDLSASTAAKYEQLRGMNYTDWWCESASCPRHVGKIMNAICCSICNRFFLQYNA